MKNGDQSPTPKSRRSVLVAAGLGLAAAATSSRGSASPDGATQQAATPRPLKIVLHVSDAGGWAPAFSNLKNLTAQYPEAKLRVIVDGSGVYLMQGTSDLSPRFQTFSGLGVEFQACHNALNEKQISPSSLPSFIQVIPAAVVALAESQYAGFAYIKP